MKSAFCNVTLGMLVFSAIASLGQLTVDATGPIRGRVRQASMVRGGGVGRKIPLYVAIAALGGWDEKGEIEVDFTLTNAGNRALTIPTSPHPGDLEPVDPRASYTVKCLTLRITSNHEPGAILSGGADLYGKTRLSESLMTLTPGDSVRVITRVALPRHSSTEGRAAAFVASATLKNETVKTVNGRIVLDFEEIGSAYSPVVTLESPLQ